MIAAILPAPKLRERVAPPQQINRPLALVPVARCDGELLLESRPVGVLATPGRQPRPGRGQRLVDDLDSVAGIVVARDDQACGEQAIDHGRSSGAAERALELRAADQRAGAFRCEQTAEHQAHLASFRDRHSVHDAVGVLDQRTGDSANSHVRLARQPAEATVAVAPQLCRGKRDERQCAWTVGDLVHDLARQRGVIEAETAAAGRHSEHALEIVTARNPEHVDGAAEQPAPCGQLFYAAQEVVA